jgi:hypothetical protein
LKEFDNSFFKKHTVWLTNQSMKNIKKILIVLIGFGVILCILYLVFTNGFLKVLVEQSNQRAKQSNSIEYNRIEFPKIDKTQLARTGGAIELPKTIISSPQSLTNNQQKAESNQSQTNPKQISNSENSQSSTTWNRGDFDQQKEAYNI